MTQLIFINSLNIVLNFSLYWVWDGCRWGRRCLALLGMGWFYSDALYRAAATETLSAKPGQHR